MKKFPDKLGIMYIDRSFFGKVTGIMSQTFFRKFPEKMFTLKIY